MDSANSGVPVVTMTSRKAIMTRWAPLWDFGQCFDVFWPLSPWYKPRKKSGKKWVLRLYIYQDSNFSPDLRFKTSI